MVRTGLVDHVTIHEYLRGGGVIPQVKFLREAHLSSIINRPLFPHLPFRVAKEFHSDMVFAKSKSVDEAFRLVGTELHFFYNMLYTKIPANLFHHKLAFSLRTFSFFSAVSCLVAFTLISKRRIESIEKREYPDIAVTCLLLIGAIVLEGYTIFSVDSLAKAWTRIQLPLPVPQKCITSCLESKRAKKRIKTLGQLDLIYYFTKVSTSKFARFMFSNPWVNCYWMMFRYSQWNPIDHDLREFIYAHLKMKRGKCEEKHFNPEFVSKLLDEFKGGQVFRRVCSEKNLPILDDDWDDKLEKTDFIRCVFLWHFATNLVYYDDLHNHRVGTAGKYFKIGKYLSDYMMYLVLARPLMMPLGFSEAALRDSYKEAELFLRNVEKRSSSKAMQPFISLLFHHETHSGALPYDRTSKGRHDQDYSELSNSLDFGQRLQEFVRNERWDREEKWELISEVWMEMMTYAATYCSWKEHAQAMRRGGELLTLVSLLMAHLGLNPQIRIQDKPTDAKKEAANPLLSESCPL